MRSPNWPTWHARFLLEQNINQLLETEVSPEQLAQRLEAIHKDYLKDYLALSDREQQATHWPDYYADCLLPQDHTGDIV